jgi:hypothetical protein
MTFFAVIWSVAVFCNAPGPPGSFANQPYFNPYSQAIVLTSGECRALNDAQIGHHRWGSYQKRTFDLLDALFTLGHEEGHAHDPGFDGDTFAEITAYTLTCSQDGPCEAQADCYGVGHIAALARGFGFSKYTAWRLQRLAHRYNRASWGYSPPIPDACWG